jgi:hypothetical protein
VNRNLHFAIFDTLVVLSRGGQNLAPSLSQSEIVTLSFLGCIVSLAHGKATSDWGYEFVRTSRRGLTSAPLIEGQEFLAATGSVNAEGRLFRIAAPGTEALNRLRIQSIFRTREDFLGAACDVLLLTSPGVLKNALDHEPTLRTAEDGDRSEVLLEGHVQPLLFGQLRRINELLGNMNTEPFAFSGAYIDYLMTLALADANAYIGAQAIGS